MKILDETIEVILWLSLKHKLDDSMFLSYVCYLVPVNSAYNVNANIFFLIIYSFKYRSIRT